MSFDFIESTVAKKMKLFRDIISGLSRFVPFPLGKSALAAE